MTDREAFETWVNRDGGYLNDGDDAARVSRAIAWRAWQAATAAERERAARVCDELECISDEAWSRAVAACADKIRSGA